MGGPDILINLSSTDGRARRRDLLHLNSPSKPRGPGGCWDRRMKYRANPAENALLRALLEIFC
jgi:hypothetical protein